MLWHWFIGISFVVHFDNSFGILKKNLLSLLIFLFNIAVYTDKKIAFVASEQILTLGTFSKLKF